MSQMLFGLRFPRPGFWRRSLHLLGLLAILMSGLIAADPTVSVVATDATAAESGDVGVYTITRAGDTSAALTVQIGFSGTATLGADYAVPPATVTIPAGAASTTLIITPSEDSIAEAAETVILTVGNGPGYVVGTPATATITINDDEAPVLTVAASDATGAETVSGQTANPAKFTITRLGSRASALTVHYAMGGSATMGVDYQTVTGTATIAANGASVVVTITPVDDQVLEGDETITMTLTSGSGYAIGMPGDAQATLQDDEPQVTIVATDAAAGEGTAAGDTGLFTLTRRGRTDQGLAVHLNVSGTAVAGVDYSAVDTTVLIPAGETTATLLVAPIDDAIPEGSESVVATVLSGIDYTVGAANAATVAIADDENMVSIVATDNLAAEPGTDKATLTISRTGSTTAPLTVTYTVSGTATSGSDFTAVTGTATILATKTSVAVTITAKNDTLTESAETVVLTLNGGAGYGLGAATAATAYIRDNDTALPSLTIMAINPATAEGGSPGLLRVSRTGGDPAAPVVVGIKLSGTAANGTDYTTVPGTVTIPANATSVDIPISPMDDVTAELAETATVTLLAGPDYVLGVAIAGTVTIADNDPATVTIAGTDATAHEPGTDTGLLTLTRKGLIDPALDVRYLVSGTGSNGADYAVLPGIVTIPAGVATATIPVVPLDDSASEPSETATVTISAGVGYLIGSTKAATVTIVDDDTAGFAWSTSTPASETGTVGSLRLTRLGPTTADLSTTYTVSGTATAGADYVALSGTATILATKTYVDIPITPIDDSLVEGAETVLLTLPNTVLVEGSATGSVTINDDEPNVSFTSATTTVPESAGSVNVTVALSVPTPTNVTLAYTVGGTATNGAAGDFTLTAGTRVIPAGATSTVFTIPLHHDVQDEDDETIVLTLTKAVGAALGAIKVHTVTLTDDDATPVVSFATDASAVHEADGTATVTVVLSQESNLPVSLLYSRVGGTANPGDDFTLPTEALTFNPGTVSKTITVPIVADSVNEGDETVVIALGSPTNAGLGEPSIHTLTILGVAQTPTIAQPLTATPSPVTGVSTTLTILGADDGGEANLTYHWSTPSNDLPPPPNTGTVTFSENGTNGAKTTVASFVTPGTYDLTCTIIDGMGFEVSTTLSVTVVSTATTVAIVPLAPTVSVNGTRTFSATVRDQFGVLLDPQPTITWTATGAGAISAAGLFQAGGLSGSSTVTAIASSVSSQTIVTIGNGAPTVATAPTASPASVFATTTTLAILGADDGGEANLTYTWSSLSTDLPAVTFGAANGAHGGSSLVATFAGAGSYSLRCLIQDVEGKTVTGIVGVEVQNMPTTISVAPATVSVASSESTMFVATVRNQFSQIVAPTPTITWSLSGGGTISNTGQVQATTVGTYTVTAAIGAVSGTATVTVTASPIPAIVQEVQVTPSPVTGTTAAVSVLASDDDGELALIYAWSATGPAAVTFSASGTNAAKNATATFTQAGSYALTCTVADGTGHAATSTTTVPVSQTPTVVTVAPSTTIVTTGATRTFTAAVNDQFGGVISSPAVTWAVSSGGAIATTGAFTAGSMAGGPFTITATSGTSSGTASVSVQEGGHPPVHLEVIKPVAIESADRIYTVSYDYYWSPTITPQTVWDLSGSTEAGFIGDVPYQQTVSDAIPLGFDVAFFGRTYSAVHLSTNGPLTFGNTIGALNGYDAYSSIYGWSEAIIPFWADLDPQSGGQIVYEAYAGYSFIVQWNAVPLRSDPSITVDAMVEIFSDGTIHTVFFPSAHIEGQALTGIIGTTVLGATGSFTAYASETSNDGAAFSFVPTDMPVPEAAGRIRLVRSGSLSGDLTVQLSVTGSATAGADYEALPSSVTFYDGQDAVDVSITAYEDHADEAAETVTIDLIENAAYTIEDPASATVQIVDFLTVGFDASQNLVAETAGTVTIPVRLSRVVGHDVAVPWTVQLGEDSQLSGATSGVVVIAAGSLTGTITMTVIDTPTTGSPYSWVSLRAPDGSFTGLDGALIDQAHGSATIWVLDDEAVPAVAIQGPYGFGDIFVWEGTGSAGGGGTHTDPLLTVSIWPPVGKTITVPLTPIDGTALAGTDYLVSVPAVVFAPGETVKTVAVTIFDDAIREPNKQFAVTAEASPDYTLTGTGSIAVLIQDDDNRRPIAVPDLISMEEGGTITIDPLTNDSDPDGDAISLYYLGTEAYGGFNPDTSGGLFGFQLPMFPCTITQNPDHTVTIVAGPGASGYAYIPYSVQDNWEAQPLFSSITYIKITVHAADPHSVLVGPSRPYNATAWQAALAAGNATTPGLYPLVSTPGRIWETATPGPGIPHLIAGQRDLPTTVGGTVMLVVQHVPAHAPLTFFCFGKGHFANGRNLLTVDGGTTGEIAVPFTAPDGGETPIVAASPLASGQVRFVVRVTP
jgi:hypothetical protein